MKLLRILLLAAATATAHAAEIPNDAGDLDRVAGDAARRLMKQLDIDQNGYADQADAELLVARGRGQADTLAVQGAMRYDIDLDGVITEDEVRAFARRIFDLQAGPDGLMVGTGQPFDVYVAPLLEQFHAWDLDHDGKVTREEVTAYLSSEDPHRDRSVRDEYRRHIHAMDADGDGRLTIEEIKSAFVRAATTPQPPPPPKVIPSAGIGLRLDDFVVVQATAILKEFDAGADGRVTKEHAIEKGGTNCYLLSMDEEGDGFVDRAKIERRARAAAHVADVDRDGLLSQSEIIDAWSMLHGMKVWKLPEDPKRDR